MRKFLLELGHFRRSEDGATLVEYGIALLIVVVVGATALLTIAEGTRDNFADAGTAITTIRAAVPE
ncbi:MAG: Flp family type IVb pilin [Alphaproteobacteria bacterium HGW-Alphaproteobacteria-2]|nr:MAG: Flp family type IVb pilin [Alphaproteobacteria bacterium HGW-Alphaproteobacteria-2]